MLRSFVWSMVGVVAVILISGPANASRYVEKRPFPLVTVTGEGSVAVKPNMAEITAGVSSEAKSPRDAAAANAKTMTAVINAIRSAGIPENDVGTTRYAINPVYASKGRGETQQVVGYRVSNLVRVRIKDLARAGDVLDQMIEAGATNVGGIDFDASNAVELKDRARTAAFADAKRKAELFAKAAGAQLGRATEARMRRRSGVSQRLDRIELRGAHRRIPTEEHAH
jgi:uncharacterized protein